MTLQWNGQDVKEPELPFSTECIHCFEPAVQDTELCQDHLDRDVWQQADDAYTAMKDGEWY